MKMIMLASVLVALASAAKAGPYFQFKPGSKLSMGAYFAPTDSIDKVNWGQVVPVIVHEAKDGYLLVPGVDWDLLDVGWINSVGDDGRGVRFAVGPSVNIEEPIKSVLRRVVDALPNAHVPGAYGVLRAVLASPCSAGVQDPAKPGAACQEPAFPTLSLGPSFVMQTRPWKGVFMLSATLSKRF